MRSLLSGRLLVFGLLVYLVILALTFPAQYGYAYWQGSETATPNVALAGINGSIWSGQADVALINGQRLESLEWHFQPWSLLRGQVGLSWRLRLPDTQGDGGYGQGSTRLGLDGSIVFPTLEGRVPAIVLASLGGAKAVRPTGSVSINLLDVRWDGRSLVSANGRVVWNGAGINILKPITLGGLVLNLETSDDDLKGVLSDASGPLAAEGVLSLKPDGSYSFSAAFNARQGVAGSGDLAAALSTLGRPGPDGKYHLNQSGHLADFGLAPPLAR